ncbi:hypothetical protein PCANC_10831 [Puccinia coronata f. sp. avenae]|uniref:Uncharacterized protein n=1 Tax=Puccinia coronata f. sp. avenae TaxID=200324 RepID=A0A2N5V0U4_9BASI|nr:hypothetical protein PCANC_10831 [Puccinia coronata f. sp. avenae]
MLDESHPSSKYYAWVPEDEPASQEIQGDVDPSNIIESGRRTCHSANSAILSHDDPRTYHQAVSAYNSRNWESAISIELGNMDRLNVWFDLTAPAPNPTLADIPHTIRCLKGLT